MKSAKFKDSLLGPIPQDWEVKRLGDVWVRFSTGPFGSALHASDYVKDGTPVVNPMHILDGKIVPSTDMRINDETLNRLSSYRLCKNDIILGRRGEMGRAALVTAKEDGWLCGTGSFSITLDSSVSPDYIALYIRTPNCITAMENGAIGTTIPNLNQVIVSNIPIALPPLPEQQRIAEALGEVDKLIESLDEQIEKKRLIAKGVAHDLLSGKKRLPGFKGAWREVAFKAAFISLGNNTYARECLCGYSTNAYDIHYGDVLIRFGAVVDFSSDYIPRLKDGIKPNKDFLQNGDIVFADTAEDEMVGKAVEVRGLGDGKAVSGLHTMACRPRADMFAPRFLGYYLNSDSYRKQLLPLITGSKVSSLSRANFESTILTMPDVIEQQAIADLLGEQDAAIAALEEKREKYARIKEGMMRDLLTGKVRMKGE